MAKYVVGYVLALVIGLMVLGGTVWSGVSEPRFGPVVTIEPAIPVPEREPTPESFPVNLIVSYASGRAFEEPYSACWTSSQSGTCLDGFKPSPQFAQTHAQTKDEPIHLHFEVAWSPTVETYREDTGCLASSEHYPSADSVQLGPLGPPGLYRVEVAGLHRQGNAEWVIWVDNQADHEPQGDC